MSDKKLLEKILRRVKSAKKHILLRWQILRTMAMQKKVLKKLSGKQQLNCVFFALESSVWKYDRIYQIMSNNSRFNPVILVCPIVNFGENNMIRKMEECYRFFKKKGYKVIKSYNEIDNTYYDVRRLQPDIVFFTNPYKGLIDDRYFITNLKDVLTVYVPYFMNCSKVKGFSNNLPLHNLVWRKYAETTYEYNLAKIEQIRHGSNVVYTGYPGIERLIDKNYKPATNPWKNDNKNLKKIIWAPHHTIEKGNYGHTCFLEYCDFMLEIAKEYEDHVQFVFKPHPILKSKLELLWGNEKTKHYYNSWDNLPNATLHQDDYIDLFLTSDAMIHDSGSFIVEYLYVNKPVMRTISDLSLDEVFNQFGLDCLKQYYLSYTKKDVVQFIQNIINGVDPMKDQRTNFINHVLMPQGSPSQRIVDDIINSIDNQKLYCH